MTHANDNIMRRKPQRVRGRERVARILDAAERVFAEVGHEAATMEDIARRSETAIGSLYQFFPNKAAILGEVVTRYQDDLERMFTDDMITRLAGLPTSELLDHIIEQLIVFNQTHNCFHQLFLDTYAATRLPGGVDTLRTTLIAKFAQLYTERYSQVSLDRSQMIAVITVTILITLLTQAATETVVRRKQIVIETKMLLAAYLDQIEANSDRG